MCKIFHFCAGTGECLLKDAGQYFHKKPVITLVYKLRPWLFKFDFGGDIYIKLHVVRIIKVCV